MTRWLGGMVVLGGWLGACSLETEPYPGGGGGPGSTSISTTTATGSPCTVDEECADQDANPCTTPTCAQGACLEIADDGVVPPGGTECRVSACLGGEVVETLPGEETGCGADPMKTHCDGMGKCTGCTTKNDCLSGIVQETECQTWECVDQKCVPMTAPAGPLPDDLAGDCTKRRCDGNGTLILELDDSDTPPEEDPPNPCTEWTCPALGIPANEIQVGDPCGFSKTCTDTYEKAQDTCDEDGVCQPGAVTECLPFVCDPAAVECKTDCTPATQDQDCAAGYCEASLCKPKIEAGMPCSAGGQCFTGFCTDGVCCSSACDTPCNSCDLGGGTPGVCSPLPKGLIDTCDMGSACNGGACAPLSTKKAVGQSCIQESDCYNDVSGSIACINGFCRLPLGSACDQGPSWHCGTRFCDSTGACAECTTDADCGPGGVCKLESNVDRCDFGPGGVCGNDNDCGFGTTCMGASASGPGTCQ